MTTRTPARPVRFESWVFALRDPNCGAEQAEAFHAAAGHHQAVYAVNLHGPAEGGGDDVYVDADGNSHRCPVGCGMVVFDRSRPAALRVAEGGEA